jgi:predicted PurR-regulated permease PerM
MHKLLQWFILGLFFPLIALNGWILLLIFQYFQSLIHVIAAATLLSFILDYPVQRLERCRIRRTAAILLAILGVLLLLAILGVTLIPIAIEQFNGFLERLPTWFESARVQLESLEAWATSRRLPLNLSSIASQLLERLSSQLQDWSGHLFGGIVSTVGRVLDVILTFVLTFYLLLYGEQLWDGLFQMLPIAIRDRVRQSLGQNFHNYFIGQATLAGIIGLSTTLVFLILQVPFGLLFGLAVGVMALIPFGGVSGICLVSFLIALNSAWLGMKVFVVAIALEQAIENAIAPRLLGGFTGLNPVWVLVSLLLGAKIAGFLGLIVAVPVAGFIKSLVEIFREENSLLLGPPNSSESDD